jgi:hypothetical protein
MTSALAICATFGPLVLMALWMALLNRRDRRRDALEGTVGACCTELGLRGAFAVHARVGTLSGRVRVVLDMRLCTTGHVWQVMERLPPRLPHGASLCIVAKGPHGRPSQALFHRTVVALV